MIVPGTPECGECYWCVRGRPDQCAHLFVGQPQVATRANGEPLTSSGGGGTYAELMRVPSSWIFPVETDLPDDTLSLFGCGVTTGLGAVFNAAKVEAGSSVAVVGCGHLGLWMIQGARVAGAERIIAVEPNPGRRAVAGKLGATHLVDPREGDSIEQVRELTEGRGVDYALEAAGNPDAQTEAIVMSRKAGTVVLTGLATFGTTVSVNQVELALRGRTIQSCQNGMSRMGRDIPRYARMLEDGVVDARPIITAHYALEDINDALAESEAHNDLSGVIVPGRRDPQFSQTLRAVSRRRAAPCGRHLPRVRRDGSRRVPGALARAAGGTSASASRASRPSRASPGRCSASTSRSACG